MEKFCIRTKCKNCKTPAIFYQKKFFSKFTYTCLRCELKQEVNTKNLDVTITKEKNNEEEKTN